MLHTDPVSQDAYPSAETCSQNSEYIASVYSLLPEISDLISLQNAQLDLTIRNINRANEYVGRDAVVLSKTNSSTHNSVATLSRQIIYSVDSIDEYVDIVVRARQQGLSEANKTFLTSEKMSPEIELTLRSDLREDAEIHMKERVIAQNVQQRYAEMTPTDQDRVIELLFVSPKYLTPEEKQVYDALIIAFAIPSKDSDGTTQLEAIIEKVNSGEADAVLFKFAYSSEDLEKQTGSIKSLTEFVLHITTKISPDISEEQIVQAVAESTNELTNGSKTELHSIRQNILQTLMISAETIRHRLGIPKQVRDVAVLEQQLARVMENFIYEFNRKVIDQRTQPRVAKRIQQNKTEVKKLEEGKEPEKSFKPRRVRMAIAGEGSLFTPTDETDKLEEAKQAYIDRFPGAANFSEKINDALEYISKADFSTGRVRGIGPTGMSVTIDNKVRQIYSLKPSDAVGIGINSDAMRNTRIMFVLNDQGDAVILKFMKRSERGQFDESFGLGKTRHK